MVRVIVTPSTRDVNQSLSWLYWDPHFLNGMSAAPPSEHC